MQPLLREYHFRRLLLFFSTETIKIIPASPMNDGIQGTILCSILGKESPTDSGKESSTKSSAIPVLTENTCN